MNIHREERRTRPKDFRPTASSARSFTSRRTYRTTCSLHAPSFDNGFLVPVVVILLFGAASCVRIGTPYEPKEGDIVFQSLRQTELVRMIEGASKSKFSHCGVVFRIQDDWKVIEAYGNVHYTPLSRWLARGRDGGYAVYRFDERYTGKMKDFRKTLESYIGHPYDYRYDFDDEFIYCSELVYKAFDKIYGEKLGKLEHLGDLDWRPFTKTIERFEGGPPPLDRMIITPGNLSRARQLTLVRGY
jgi:hypothetical protein